MTRLEKKPMPKRFGALKQISSVAESTSAPPSPKKSGKFGAIKPEALQQGSSSLHPRCYAKCQGAVMDGVMWIHSPGCPYTVVLWRAHGFTASNWECPYGCQATALPSGWTHDYRCPFWNATGQTPIGLKAPLGKADDGASSGRSPVVSRSDSSKKATQARR